MKIVAAIFEKMKILIFFLCKRPLILRVVEKENPSRNIFKRTLDIRFERNWSVYLGVMLGDGHTENVKKIFS